MARSCVIVGGGFKGMIGAWLLRKKGFDVALVDKAPNLGGIMHSREWNGFAVDNGVQMFDSIPKNLGAIVEDVMDGKVAPIEFKYASVFNDVATAGLALPDLTQLPAEVRAKILYELIEVLPTPPRPNPASLYERFIDLYGKTAADLLDAGMDRLYSAPSRELEPDGLRQTSFHRLRFLSNEMTLELKKHPELDKRLAAMRKVLGKVDDLVSIYPTENGMRGFCQRMTKRLREMGVEIRLDTLVKEIRPAGGRVELQLEPGGVLKADRLVWAHDYGLLAQMWLKDDRLSKLVHGSPMVVYWYQIDQKRVCDYIYFQQFTPGRFLYRVSCPGLYGRQVKPDGTTYICAEVPSKVGSALWNDPAAFASRVWDECVQVGLLQPGTPCPKELLFAKAPVTHRFPKVGFNALAKEMEGRVAEAGGAIIVPNQDTFTRREIMWSMEQTVERMTAS